MSTNETKKLRYVVPCHGSAVKMLEFTIFVVISVRYTSYYGLYDSGNRFGKARLIARAFQPVPAPI